MEPLIAEDGTQLDPQVVKLMKGIKTVESGGNYGAKGKSGEKGAFQWMPGNFEADAQSFGFDPKDFSPANQNKVAYHKIKALKDKGYQPDQVAAAWNAGEGSLKNDAWKTRKGVNKYGAEFDTPAYVQKVIASARGQQLPGAQFPDSSPSPTFLGSIKEDFAKREQNAKEGGQRMARGEQGVGSTIFQSIGQGAGFVGDVLFDALAAADRVLTGGRAGEALGNVAEKIGQTAPAQALAEGYQGFKEEHPVGAANFEAAVNIGSLIPIGKGGQVAGRTINKGAQAAATKGQELLQDSAVKAVDDLKAKYGEVLQSTKPLKNQYEFITSKGNDPARVLSERKIILDVNDGKIGTTNAIEQLETEVAGMASTLDRAIGKYKLSVNATEAKAILRSEIGRDPELRAQGRVAEIQGQADNIIDTYAAQVGRQKFSLSEIQAFKKGQYQLSKKFKLSDVGRADAHSEVASAFRAIIEHKADDIAVKDLNRKIGELEDTIRLLERANNTAVKGGRLGRYFGRVIGAAVGSQGTPVIGPILGALFGDALAVALQKSSISGPLNRLLIRIANTAPDNKVVQDTLDFIEAVERGEKVVPSDDVLEFLAQVSVQANIPLLPAPMQREFQSIISQSKQIDLPERSQSTLDAMERANPDITQPQSRSAIQPPTMTPTTIDKISTPQSATQKDGVKRQDVTARNTANGDSPDASDTNDAWPTTASKPSTAKDTSTGSAPTGKEGVSAQRADTSGPFEGEIVLYRGGEKFDPSRMNAEGVPFTVDNSVAERFARIKNQFDAGPAGQALGRAKGQNIVEKFYLSPSAKIAVRSDIPDEVFNAYKQANPQTKPHIAEPIINGWAREHGFDAIDYRTLGKTSASEAEIKILNPDVLKRYSSAARPDGSLQSIHTPITSRAPQQADPALSVTSNNSSRDLSSISSKNTPATKTRNEDLGITSPSIPKELEPLAAEARKYKTAEEFVKAQGTPVYHGTTKEYADAINKGGFKENAKNIRTEGMFGNVEGKARAIFFADDVRLADEFGKNRAYVLEKEEAKPIEAFVNQNANILDLTKLNTKTIDIIDEAINKMEPIKGFVRADNAEELFTGSSPIGSNKTFRQLVKNGEIDVNRSIAMVLDSESFTKSLKNLGYDGVRIIEPGKKDFGLKGNIKSKTTAIFNPDVVKTKSQLTDIWNKANKGGAEQSLLAEARKYKSAEEFVKKQTLVYHGSATPLKSFEPRGAFFTDDMMSADGYARGENVYEGYINLKKPLVIDAKGRKWDDLEHPLGATTQDIAGSLDTSKYDGIIFKNIKDNWIDDADAQNPGTIYYAANARDAFLNEDQLTDFFNRVKGRK